MNKWVKYLLIVLEVGGGFSGILLILILQQWNPSIPEHAGFFYIFCISLLFLFGIVAGLALVERPELGSALSVFYQALQIPVVSSRLLTYEFLSGLQVGVGWQEGKPAVFFEFGSRLALGFMMRTAPYPGMIGVNMLALVLFVYLLLKLRPKAKCIATCGE